MLLAPVLLAIAFSALSAIAFGAAIVLGLRLSDVRGGEVRRIGESRAALAAGVGTVTLILAALFWPRYLIFGPIRDLLVEAMGAGDD